MDAFLRIDLSVARTLYALRTEHMVRAFEYVTAFGNAASITLFTLAALFVFFIRGKFSHLAGLLASVLCGTLSMQVLKVAIARARPSGLLPVFVEHSYSFPSGHATLSIALFGFLAYSAPVLFSSARAAKWATVFLCALMVLVPFSRLYLGVHYFSDVLAGLALGTLCLGLGVWLERRLA